MLSLMLFRNPQRFIQRGEEIECWIEGIGHRLLISDGNSEIGAHVGSNLCYLICIRHLFRSSAVAYLNFYLLKRHDFIHM